MRTAFEMEHDDFDDKPMTDLMRGWGQKVRAEGPDRASMHAALDGVDAEGGRVRRTWVGNLTAVAAVVLVGMVIWRFVTEAGLPALPGEPPMLRDVSLSKQRDIVRGQPAPKFAKGDSLYVQYYAERRGFATAVLLRPPSSATMLTSGPVALSTEGEPLGPFPLRGEKGLVGVFLLLSEFEPNEADTRKLVDAAVEAMRTNPTRDGPELRAAIATAFEGTQGVDVVCIPFVQ